MSGETYLNYEDALRRIEAFMTASGIREYCETKCFGHCCQKCFYNDTACHKNEGRRLACSFYLCEALLCILFPHEETRARYEKLGRVIRAEISSARGFEKTLYENPYYVPYAQSTMRRFRMKQEVLNRGLPGSSEIFKMRKTLAGLGSLVAWASKRQIADEQRRKKIYEQDEEG